MYDKIDKEMDRIANKMKGMEKWLARHIKQDELPLAINLPLCPEATAIINKRLKHG